MGLNETSIAKKIIDYDAFIAETGIDENEIMELYEVFHDEIIEEKAKLSANFSINDFVKLGRTVHNIKGISGSYKAVQMFEQARLMDINIKSGKTEGLERSITQLIEIMEAAAAEIEIHFDI